MTLNISDFSAAVLHHALLSEGRCLSLFLLHCVALCCITDMRALLVSIRSLYLAYPVFG